MQIEVRPIRSSDPGSFGQQRRLARTIKLATQAQQDMERAQKRNESPADAVVKFSDALDSIYDLLASRATVTEGAGSIDDALEELSMDEAIALLQALGGEPAVTPLTSTSSEATSPVPELALNGPPS